MNERNPKRPPRIDPFATTNETIERVTAAKRAVKRQGVGAACAKLRTPLGNAALYTMLALDILYIVLMVTGGYRMPYLVCACIALSLEGIAVLTLLPVPVLQVRVVKRNIGYAIVFAALPFLQILWCAYLTSYGGAGAVYYLLLGAHVLLWLCTFVLSRFFYLHLPAALAAAVMVLIALCGAASMFEYPLGTRPMRFTYVDTVAYDVVGYAVTDILECSRDNVRIPSTYKGVPVVSVNVTGLYDITHLELPDSVTRINLEAANLQTLVISAPGARIGRLDCPRLRSITFTSAEALPEQINGTEEWNENTEIRVPRELLDAAMQVKYLAACRDRLVPVTDGGTGYVMYYTDCVQPSGSTVTAFTQPAEYPQAGAYTLPQPDLSDKGFAFMGWYDSREYTNKVERVEGSAQSKVYAKTYRLYSVHLLSDRMELLQDIKYHYETPTFTLPDPEEKEGYAFVGWYDINDEPQRYGNIREIPVNSTGEWNLISVYKQTYPITLHADGGTVTGIPDSFHEWTDTAVLPSAQKEGYTFMGWYRDAEFTDKITQYPYKQYGEIVREELHLYAKFNQNYKITYHYNGGNPPSGTPPATQYHTEQTVKLPTPSRTGYKFDGWYSTPAFTDRSTSYILVGSTGNKTYYAKWTPITYWVHYYAGGGSGSMSSSSLFTFNAENTFKECAFRKPGYTFTGWTVNDVLYESLTTRVNFASTANASVSATATWAPVTYKMRFLPGEATGDPVEMSRTYDESFTFPDSLFTYTGHTFTGWRVGNKTYAGGEYTVTDLATEQDATVEATALWCPIAYDITYAMRDDDRTYSVTDGVSYNEDKVLQSCNYAPRGHVFTGWKREGDDTVYAAGETVKNLTETSGAVITFTAQYRPVTYTLKYIINFFGSKPQIVKEVTLTYGEPYLLENCTETLTGYVFGYWNIQTERDNHNVDMVRYDYTGEPQVYDFRLTDGRTAEASVIWIPVTYTVRYASGAADATGETADSTFTYLAENELRDCGFERDGYEFYRWEYKGVYYEPGKTKLPFADTQDAVLVFTAVWKEEGEA